MRIPNDEAAIRDEFRGFDRDTSRVSIGFSQNKSNIPKEVQLWFAAGSIEQRA